MGATYSKEESYTLHNDDNGSWSRHSLSHRHQRERLYDPDKKALRDMSRPLGTVNLYDDNYIAKYRGNWHKSMSATERSKINLKTKFFGAVGKAGTAGYNKAVGVLDAMGSSMIGLHKGSAFTSASKMKADKIGILAFEVANTVSKANKLKESLSKNNIKYLEEEILCSYGVQRLVSTDKRELLNIAAADKKKELMVFVKEVTRFGSQSRDPQWHCLGRHFYKLKTDRDVAIPDVSYFEEKVRSLFLWAQQTGVLYQELSGLDRCQAEIQQMLRDEDHSDDHQKAKDLSTFHDELKTRKKTVKLLKKKSLWSKTLDEVMENLVNAVYYLHSEIEHSFRGTMTLEEFSEAEKDCERLGALGLALHYAYIIVQIDGLVSRAASVPLQARDNLYQSLPPTVKKSLRRRIFLYKMSHDKNMLLNTLYFQQELEKILSWLTPMANNTIKVHHGFGWVGEWANAGSSSDSNITEQPQFSLQTLHYADRAAMEECILELLVLLHYLVASAQENVADSMHSSYACPSVQSRDDIPDSQTSFGSNNVQCGILSTGEPTNLSTQAKPCHEKLPNKENSLYALMKNESQSIKDELSLSFLDRVHSLEVDRVKSLDRMDRVEDIDSMHSARTPLADGNIKMQISLDH